MDLSTFTPKLPTIPEAEQTPLVRSLLQIIVEQQEQIQRLEDEIRRLKGGPPRPQIKPSTLESSTAPGAAGRGTVGSDSQRPRGPQRQKTATLTIHRTEPVPVPDGPAGSEFKGYRP